MGELIKVGGPVYSPTSGSIKLLIYQHPPLLWVCVPLNPLIQLASPSTY